MTMTEKLDQLMAERGIGKAELARQADIPYMTIVNFYVKGTENVKRSTLLKLSRFFRVTVDYLAVDEETRRNFPEGSPSVNAGQAQAAPHAGEPDVQAQLILLPSAQQTGDQPPYGLTDVAPLPTAPDAKPRLRAMLSGRELFNESNILCFDPVPGNLRCDFTLSASDGSMDRTGICKGDIVYIRLGENVKSNDIAAVVVDGRLALRRVYRNADGRLVLLAENPAFAPFVASSPERVRILGSAIAFTGRPDGNR